jgi:apolipoprotein N-acyltransferase
LSQRTIRRRRAVLYALLHGTVGNAGGFYWIADLLERFGKLPGPVAILGLLGMAAYQAAPFVLLVVIARSVREKSAARRAAPLPMALIAPLVMAAMETAWPVNLFLIERYGITFLDLFFESYLNELHNG